MSNREDFILNIIDVLKDMRDPKPILVTREPFEPTKLAITQFPAILVQSGNEIRDDNSMGVFRQGVITYTIRGFVRGPETDRKRNDLIERIEETLDTDRKRGTNRSDVTTNIIEVNVVPRLEPLGEIEMLVQVRYRYQKGVN